MLGAGTGNGNAIVQWSVPQGTNDDWCFVDKGSGYYAIYNRNSKKVLAVPNKSMQSWTKLIQWDFVNSPDQLWRLAPVAVSDLCISRYGPVPTPSSCDVCDKIGSESQLDNKATDLLNTAVDNETPAMTTTRLSGEVPM